MAAVYVTGDVHGHVDKLRTLLRDADLIDAQSGWTGADSALWFIGDLVDHGPDGIGAIDLIMSLQSQAAATNGRIEVLLGNHDALLLAAHRFGPTPFPGTDKTFRETWEESGGVEADLERLTPARAWWLSRCPAMARAGEHLLVHADALLYSCYGDSIDEVNRTIRALLQSDDPTRWAQLLEEFEEHGTFAAETTGAAAAKAFLAQFGGEQIVHGHTPITKMTGQPPEAVREPLLYAGDCCLNVDAGMYLGGPGFVYQLRGDGF